MVKTKFEDIEAIKAELLIPIDKKWWTLRPDLTKPINSAAVISNVIKLRQEAEHLIEVERKKYVAYKQLASKSDYNWINSVLTGGTFADRLSANTLLIQDSPVHNLFSLHKLIDIVNCKGIRECLMSMDNLKDLFIGDLLLKDKKMKPFMELIAYLPPKEGPLRTKLLILFYFEDQLLVEYRRFLEILAKVSMEGNDAVKSKAVNVMWELLCERPEQESFLLEKLVNKLGDPVAKRASQVVKLLGKLVNQRHPKMKEIVVKEVELLLFRQHIPELAQFYGLCFLSQILLDSRDKELATRMVNVYFNFFDSSTKKTNKDVKNRMMNVLITGLSRASPYATMEADLLEKRLESFYKVIHLVNQNTSVQGMVLIFNLIDSKDSGLISDRLYTLLYRSLLEINMETCTRRALYLNLLYKAMKRDSMPLRVKAFVKRLLQIALHQPPSIVCAIMVLLSSLIKSKPELLATFRPTKAATILNDQDEDEHYEDVELDEEDEEKISKKSSKDKSRKGSKKEKKKDIEEEAKKELTKSKNDSKQSTAWVHTKNFKKDRQISGEYDLMARNPLYANTQFSVNWELTLLRNHFHPSANMFAVKTINGESIDYDGDPLQDFTLKRFMDRFVFRNPKQINRSQAVQSSKSTLFARLDDNKSTPIQELANSARANVPVEEQFIYDYLVQKKKETEDRDKDDDNESVASEDFERLLLKFEPDFDKDDDAFMKVKKSKRKEGDDGESGTDDSEGMFSDDDDFEIDSDDDYYRAAFDGVDQEIADANYDDKTTFLSEEDIEEIGEDEEGDESDMEENMETSRFKRRGRDKNLVNLFAAADKFSHLLEGKESDDEKNNGSDDDDDGDGGRRRGKRKPSGKRSNNQKGKVYRQKKRR